LLIGTPKNGISQRVGIAPEDYMRAIGWEDDFMVMKNILQNELANRVEDKPSEYYNDNANFFSMVLLLSGVKPIHFYKLNQNGVDVINAITANVRPFDEQSLLSDVVIIGTVSEIFPEDYEDDGFEVSVKIQVNELLKGEVPSDTIIIRQRSSSRLPGSDNRPELNEPYLFLLSSGMYGYHKANYQMRMIEEIVVSPPEFGKEDVFVIYRLYPYRNGQLLRAPQTKDTAFRALRFVDVLLGS
jgi:hypothetical protein